MSKKIKNKRSFAENLSQSLAGTPKATEDTKALFFTKGILLILMALGIYFSKLFNLNLLVYSLAGFMVLDGLIMITANLINEQAPSSYRIMAVIAGGITIILGAVSILFPNMFIGPILYLLVIGICLDTFFTIASVLFLTKTKENVWWATGAGLMAIIVLAGILFYAPMMTWSLWLAIYAVLVGIYYCATPLLFAADGKKKKLTTKRKK